MKSDEFYLINSDDYKDLLYAWCYKTDLHMVIANDTAKDALIFFWGIGDDS